MKLLQVTLGAAATPLVQQQAGGTPTQLYTAYQSLIFQNNAAHVARVGDSTVSNTRGIVLPAGSTTAQIPLIVSCSLEYSGDLSEVYLFGTPGDVIDVMVIE